MSVYLWPTLVQDMNKKKAHPAICINNASPVAGTSLSNTATVLMFACHSNQTACLLPTRAVFADARFRKILSVDTRVAITA